MNSRCWKPPDDSESLRCKVVDDAGNELNLDIESTALILEPNDSEADLTK